MPIPSTQDNTLINALLDSQVYDHHVEQIKLVETHISWVILTGAYAYKIKKPLNLGFLDFSSLEKRKQCCEEELRLNRRTAPDIYLEVVEINGTKEKPGLSSNGETIEYAVKMKQFPQQSQLDRVLINNKLTLAIVNAFAKMIVDFHQSAAVANPSSEYGNGHHVLDPVNESLEQILDRVKDENCYKTIKELDQWIKARHKTLLPLINKRKENGFVRECHGDLHLRNLAWIDNQPVAFDCIEFNPYLRWIDVMSDIAFLIMDLQERNQSALAQQFLNSYLESTGDYQGIELLTFYLMYRALVRAKVNAISMTQIHTSSINDNDTKIKFYSYLNLARSYTQKNPIKLIIMHGVSASGKTTFSQQLLNFIPAIRVRSDIERKRMLNLQANDNTRSRPGKGIYTKEISNNLYGKLANLSKTIINAGYSVIIDAAFLEKEKRDQFKALAKSKNVDFFILSFSVPDEDLRQRITQRTDDASDADLSVLETQLLNFKSLDISEQTYSHIINTNTSVKYIASIIKS